MSAWDDKSREVLLTCDRNGVIRTLDRRAERLLCVNAGVRLRELAAPGVEEKLDRLLEKARTQPVDDWEVALICAGRPSTFVFSARGAEDGLIELFGVRLPERYGQTVEQLTDSINEVVELNREVTRQKREIERQKHDLERAYRELDESNRGVLALHKEIADKSDTIQRSADVKSRLLANVSHELRTPLHTIRGLAGLLLDGVDGHLNEEQRKQINFIRHASEELTQMVSDLLDLSKAESGKVMVRPERFTVPELFAALRGQMRPLLDPKRDVELVFEDPEEPMAMESDHGKIAQILRNLVSNALKFTVEGSVKVKAELSEGTVRFFVEDTGVGVEPIHRDAIFEEFVQVEHPLQRQVKGTGLGLPLSRRLAALLGGTLELDRRPRERGSLFILSLPAVHPEVRELAEIERRPIDPAKPTVLIVEDDRKTIFVYEKYLTMAGFQVIPARSTEDAQKAIETRRPTAIILDVMLDGEASWEFLSAIKNDPKTHEIPVLVVTVTNKAQKARALGADEFWLKPIDPARLIKKLRSLALPGKPARLLIIDDDPASRYLIKKTLSATPYTFNEAASGREGVQLAREMLPSLILLDFLLKGETAFDVLDELKADPRTRTIPVIIITSHLLPPEERERLAAQTEAILSKETLSRELAINRIRDALMKAHREGYE